ncbi:hypothetical protein Hamer_G023651, partial [Homarus americanus]
RRVRAVGPARRQHQWALERGRVIRVASARRGAWSVPVDPEKTIFRQRDKVCASYCLVPGVVLTPSLNCTVQLDGPQSGSSPA